MLRVQSARFPISLGLLLVILLALTACGDDGAAESDQPTTTEQESDQPTTTAADELTTTSGEPALVDVSVRLDWLPGGSHVGYFVAQQLGWYEEVGLNVEIIPGQGSTEVVQQVAAGTDTFGNAYGVGIVPGRAQGAQIRVVANTAADAAACIIVRADSGIETPQDLEGRTIGAAAGSPFAAVLPAIWDHAGVDGESIEILEMSAQAAIPALAEGTIDGFTGVAISDTVTLELDFDTEPYCIAYRDYGASFVGPSIIASEETIANDPEVVAAFVDATNRAWRYAFENPEEAGRLLEAGAAGIEGARTAEAVAASLPPFKDTILSGGANKPMGSMTAEDWEGTIQLMVNYLGLEDPPAPEDLFTNEFVSDQEPLE